ncbi:MAG: hypothetical protein WDM71_06735 [Ferruginibacter sp.]
MLLGSQCIAQKESADSAVGCNFYQRLTFKHNTDTFFLKVNFLSIGEPNSYPLSVVIKKYKLNPTSFGYSVEFSVADCSEKFYVPSKDKTNSDKLYSLKPRTQIKLKCIFFKDVLQKNGEYFFIIDKILFK